MPEDDNKFFVGVFKEEGKLTGYSSASSAELAKETTSTRNDISTSPTDDGEEKSPFAINMSDFLSMMQTYRSFVPITLGIGVSIVPVMTERLIERFVKKKGEFVSEHSTDGVDIYRLSYDDYRDFTIQQDEIRAAAQGSRHIPEVMVIGLISSYDAFLSNVLRTIFNAHEEIVLTSDKMISFSEVSRFASLQEAKNFIIDKEVESVIRKSHHDQFKWMEGAFKITLRSNLDVWPKFIEICERRNLLTHTGGVVSQQYLDNCAEHKCKMGDTKVGDKLQVNSEYYSSSVDAVSEIGIKLCYVMWRKFAKQEQEKADTVYNEACFNLIETRCYNLAEQLLKFGVLTLAKGGSERTRRMMIVNLANATRLQKRKEEAEKIIDKEDWSASGTEFQICSKAAKGDLNSVISLMKEIGSSDRTIDATTYRIWPVFRELRKEAIFAETFKEIFGEDLIKGAATLISGNDSHTVADAEVASKDNGETRH